MKPPVLVKPPMVVSLPENGIVVGIDVGTGDNCGWAIVNLQGELLESGVYKLGEKAALESRLVSLHKALDGFVLAMRMVYHKEFHGHLYAVGIETPWVGKNIQSALRLGKAWGVVAASFMEYVVPYTIYPATAKKALTGSGKARKLARVAAAQLMGMQGENDNEADAIGVALATLIQWIEEYLKNVE